MAEFCNACAKAIFGDDTPGDFARSTDEASWAEGRATVEICEGCGPIQVDPDGNCVSIDCECAGQVGHGLPWIKGGQQ